MQMHYSGLCQHDESGPDDAGTVEAIDPNAHLTPSSPHWFQALPGGRSGAGQRGHGAP